MVTLKRIVLNKVFLSLLITAGVSVTLIFTSAPVQAITINIVNPANGYIAHSYSFTVTINVEDPDVLPVQAVSIQIFNATVTDSYANLPLATSASAYYTGSAGGTAAISVTAGANWGYGFSDVMDTDMDMGMGGVTMILGMDMDTDTDMEIITFHHL